MWYSSLRPSALHMDKVFNTAHACQLKKLAKFVRIIMSHFSKKPRVDGNTVNDSSQETMLLGTLVAVGG